MNDFSLYLKKKRINNGWTQQDFVSKLNELAPCFNGLDYVTYSRWERGVTLPNMYKAFRIMDYFNDYHPSLFSSWLKKEINMKLIRYHDDYLENLKRYSDINFIESISYNLNNERYDILNETELYANKQVLEKVINFSCVNYNNGKISIEHFNKLQKNDDIKLIVLISENIVIAHTLWFSFNELLLSMLESNFQSLSFDDLTFKEDNKNFKSNCIYIQNITMVSSDWWLFSINEISQFVIKNKIDSISILVTTQNVFELILKMGFKILTSIKSNQSNKNIKYKNEYYEKVICIINREDFLTNPVVINILRTHICNTNACTCAIS